MVWPGFDFPIQLLPQPQHWESEKERHSCLAAMKELPEGLLDDTNPPCLIYQSWFWSGLHTLALNWKKMLISNGKKEISLGVSNKDSMGISLAAHHNASEVYIHSLAPASLSQYLNPHQSGPWTWPVHNSTLMCVSAPGSGGTQGIPKPSESLRHSQHNPPPTRLQIHIKCCRDTCVLCLTGGIFQQSPRCQENNTKPLGGWCGFQPTHNQPLLWASTWSFGAAPGSITDSGTVFWTSGVTATLWYSSSLSLA